MGIDDESDQTATLRIGPTTLGMVRVYVEAEGVSLPMDFEPDEALEIAEELRAAAERARAAGEPDRASPPRPPQGGRGRGGKRGGGALS